jgi:hypothetical protein
MRAAVIAAATVLLAVSAASASVRAYAVDPVRADWAGKVAGQSPYGSVAQSVTCCWGSLDAVHLFCGTRGDTNSYMLDVKDDSTGDPRLA